MSHVLVLIVAGFLLASCSVFGPIGEFLIGGPIKPSPGTPEYDAYQKKIAADEAARKQSNNPQSEKPNP
jgi:hypothetical protein